MIGTLDMAYPSNQATFGHLLNHNYDIPSILIKYPHSDHKAVRKQYDYKPYIELTKINRWGTLIPRAELEKNLKSVFERIIEKYWNVLERKLTYIGFDLITLYSAWFQVHAIYSRYYHQPEKILMKKAIQNYERDLHDSLEDRGNQSVTILY